MIKRGVNPSKLDGLLYFAMEKCILINGRSAMYPLLSKLSDLKLKQWSVESSIKTIVIPQKGRGYKSVVSLF